MIETSSRTSDAVLANSDAKIRISYDINNPFRFSIGCQANGLSIKDIALNSNPCAGSLAARLPQALINSCQTCRNKKSTKNVRKPHTLISETAYSPRHAWCFRSTARTPNGPRSRPVRRVRGRGGYQQAVEVSV